MPDLGNLADKDEFGSNYLKDTMWHNILSMASGDTSYQRDNNKAWWTDLAAALEELVADAHAIASGSMEDPLAFHRSVDPDEITPEDLPQ